MSKAPKPELELERAQYEVEQAKKQFSSTLGGLQYRLNPKTLANNAFEGVRDKGTNMASDAKLAVNGIADEAFTAVKERPGIASGVAAALLIFLAREPLWRLVSKPFRHQEDTSDLVMADLEAADDKFDLTAPTVERSKPEGVSA